MKLAQYTTREASIISADEAQNDRLNALIEELVDMEEQRVEADIRDRLAQSQRAATVDDGYIYVIEFASGTVKPGKTTNPRERMKSHAARAATHGDSIANSWLSELHPGITGTEQALLGFCKQTGTQVSGEYFRDVEFDAVAELAGMLATYARRREYLDRLLQVANHDLSMTWQQAQDLLPDDDEDSEEAD